MFGAMILAATITFWKSISVTCAKNWKQMVSRASSIPCAVWATHYARNNVHSITLHITLHAHPRVDVDHLWCGAVHFSSTGHTDLAPTGPEAGCEQIGRSGTEIGITFRTA